MTFSIPAQSSITVRLLPYQPKVHYYEHSIPEGGFKVGEIPILAAQTQTPKSKFSTRVLEITPKQHKRKRGQSLKYHLRIQKKWNKRFSEGDSSMYAYSDPKTLVTSKSLYQQILKITTPI